uniref:Protein kinase domain-containing protein n=1 Tax=Panagrolaimus sp. ES5 TaxID=591445 RepID=A0AC34F3T2_9BILA
MATKDNSLSFNDKKNAWADDSNDRFNHLNLNDLHQRVITSDVKNSPSDNRKFLQQDSMNNFKESKSTTYFDHRKSNGNKYSSLEYLNLHRQYDPEETKKMKNSTKNFSTLSLHISAYENTVEASEDLSTDDNKMIIKGERKWIKPALPQQNPFEFPRQQENDENIDPEIAAFRASQRLLNPNQVPAPGKLIFEEKEKAYPKYFAAPRKPIPAGIPLKYGDHIAGSDEAFELMDVIGGNDYPIFKVRGMQSNVMAALKYFPKEYEAKFAKELDVYQKIKKELPNSPHFCKLLGNGKHGKNSYIILTMFKCTLAELDGLRERKVAEFSNGTKIIIAKQILQGLQHLQSIHIAHGDLKWENIALGLDGHTIIIFDFELSSILDTDSRITEAPPSANVDNLTQFYASIAHHHALKLSFKDELESYFFLTAQLFVALPWDYDSVMSGEDEEPILQQKIKACKPNSEFLMKLPKKLPQMLADIRELDYAEIPYYDFLYASLNSLFKAKHVDLILDWDPTVVYHGPEIGVMPHIFQPYYKAALKYMLLIFGKEAWKLRRYNKQKQVTIFEISAQPKGHEQCKCTITVAGEIDKETTKNYTRANITATDFKCEKHKGLEDMVLECRQGDKYYFKTKD